MRRSFGVRSVFSFLAKILSKKTGQLVPSRILRAPPVRSITSPAAGLAAIYVMIANRSASGSPNDRASLRNARVSTTVCTPQYTPVEYTAINSTVPSVVSSVQPLIEIATGQ
jgi:hypothetical protein